MSRRLLLPLTAVTTTVAALLALPLVATSSAAVDHESCRPDGMTPTPGVATPYCLAYDTEGREKLGQDHGRRIIGYFTSWRTGKNGQPAYLAKDIPWDKVTHINYAFAHVDDQNPLSVGSPSPDNPSTGMQWPEVPGSEMDPEFSYQGHFNQLNKFKKQHPDVKTLVSVGGWAETGGYFENGERVASGGFYSMTTNPDGTVNQSGIDAFADSAVSFLRTYGFNGVDIDYEYPTSMRDAGYPDDWSLANGRRAGLNRGYAVLMKTLRDKLNQASAADGEYYMLTVAAPSSAYLLRGMENFSTLAHLDYVNLMSYDLHGAWNEFGAERSAVRRRQGRRAGPLGRVRQRPVRWHRVSQHGLGGEVLPWCHGLRADQHRRSVLHPRLEERLRRHERALGKGGGCGLPDRAHRVR